MKKIVSIVLAALMLAAVFAFAGCGKTNQTTDDAIIRIAALKGPTGLGVAPLMNKETYKQYDITIIPTPAR